MAFTKTGSDTLTTNAAPNSVHLSYDHSGAVVAQVMMQQTASGITGIVPAHYTAASTIADATLLADTAALMARWQVQAATDNGFTNS